MPVTRGSIASGSSSGSSGTFQTTASGDQFITMRAIPQKNNIRKVAPAVEKALKSRLSELARRVQAAAERDAPVATGAYKASLYRVSPEEDTYGEAVSAARAANPQVEILPKETEAEGEYRFIVASAAAHGVTVELGSNGQPGRAVLSQAFEGVRREAEDLLRGGVNEAIARAQ
jgi:hypothetical protein